ncbi:MAG: DNA recombination protein RmuC [Candidatus Pacebacteria bacterium]|nr:DNA recombination protein RmuC [Candidatus Paceibacterota bacterium]
MSSSLELILGLLALIFIFNIGVLVFFIRKQSGLGGSNSHLNDERKQAEQETAFRLLLQQMHELQRTVDSKMGESSKIMQESMKHQASESFKVVRDITERLTRLDETNKQVVSFADQLQSLQDILKNPKQRGILGEYYLETLLKNVLPPGSYQMQYPLGQDEAGKDLIPDAVVFVKDKIIPVDSKFSLENYNRIIEEKNPIEKEKLEKVFVADLKNRIAETSKYIQPSMGTLDFAFMFIPHEAIYYDLLINKIGALKDDTESLIQRAASKYKVIIVSPTSFLAYLQTVMQGLKALQIEETAKDIIKRVEELGKHIKSYEEYHSKHGKSLETTVNHFNASNKEFKKVDKDVMRIAGVAPGIESLVLDKPDREEE